MSVLAPATTIERTLAPRGERGRWLELAVAPGEQHRVRDDLTPVAAHAPAPPLKPCAAFVQVTDPQLCDPVSPGRMDFLRGRRVRTGGGGERTLYTVYRPAELLGPHAYVGLLETLAQHPHGPVTGLPLALALLTGDFADNAQRNELEWARAALAGGVVERALDADELARVADAGARHGWGWDPERAGADAWQREWGHPCVPGLLERAAQPLASPGLRLPALTLAGNHDLLVQGVASPGDAYRSLATGARRPVALEGPPPTVAQLEREAVVPGATAAVTVAPDARRLPATPADFARIVAASRAGRPANAGERVELGAVTVLALDTCAERGAEGVFTIAHAAWLEQQLRAASAAHGGDDRLVLVATHHSSTTLRSEAAHSLPQLLLRFPNVVAWVNGHTHVHRVHPHADARGELPGFWEITTASVADWPCQARLLELSLTADGRLALHCTLLDAALEHEHEQHELAALHRLLALNYCAPSAWAGGAGAAGDRNVVLLRTAGDGLRALLAASEPATAPTDHRERSFCNEEET
jgi:3',5'-cyclic AMP phosphodiesterase CpdA